jgi:hypothetical protein
VVGAAVGAAIFGGALWFALNHMVGWLAGRNDWWSRWYVWSAAGAMFGAGSELLRAWRARRRSDQIKRAAEFFGFKFLGGVTQSRFPDAQAMPIFRMWQSAENCAAGEIGGEPVEVLDYTYRVRGSGDSSPTDYRQTIALVGAGENWPGFNLQPRNLGHRLATGALGYEGIVLESDNLLDAPTYETFRGAYFLDGIEEFAGIGGAPLSAEEANDVARLFGPKAVRFFAENRGWRLQCDGHRLAVWRPKQLVRPQQLRDFARQAAEVRGLLAAGAAAKQRGRIVSPSKPVAASTDPSAAQAKMLGAAIGAVAGFFGLGIAGMIGAGAICVALEAFERPAMFFVSFALAALVFFGGAIGGLVAGGWAGSKWISPLLGAAWERKRERVFREDPARLSDQPIESNARVEPRLEGVKIELPPMGLRRAGGLFLFIWCIGWNTFVAIFTAVLIPAAFADQVLLNGGPETVSPVLAILFLTPFWAVGLGILFFLVHRGRRRATLLVEDGRLMVDEQTLFGSQPRSWPLKNIEAIRTEFDKNIQPPRRKIVLDLQSGTPVKLLRYRPQEEIEWLAEELRRAIERGAKGELSVARHSVTKP